MSDIQLLQLSRSSDKNAANAAMTELRRRSVLPSTRWEIARGR
jgi:hypothetical protein